MKRGLLLFILFVSCVNANTFAQTVEKKEERRRDRIGHLDNYILDIKEDGARQFLAQPTLSLEYFITKQLTCDVGGSRFWSGSRITNAGLSPLYFDIGDFLGVGLSTGYNYFTDINYFPDKTNNYRFYVGLGYNYRYSFINSQRLDDCGGCEGESRTTHFLTEKAYTNAFRINFGYMLNANNSRHWFFNPHISIMPGVANLTGSIDSSYKARPQSYQSFIPL